MRVVTLALEQTTVQAIISVAGIVGTLLGALIGAVVTWRVQKSQREHEDRTRFHEERVKRYTDFTSFAAKIMAARTLGHQQELADLAGFTRSFETVRLIASGPVRDTAHRVQTIVTNAVTAVAHAPRAQPMADDYNVAMRALLDAMRSEINVK